MLSKLLQGVGSLLLGLTLLHCDSREARVTDVCKTLARCSEFLDPGECDDQLTDALRDERISRAGLSRCAHCLGSHRSQPGQQDCSEHPDDCQNCESVLKERDCDVACSEIDYAQRTRTSRKMRDTMCATVGQACGTKGGATCSAALGDLYKDTSGSATTAPSLGLEESLALDATVEGCWKCTEGARKALDKQQRAASPDTCALLVSACADACSLVHPVNQVLSAAGVALQLCDLKARCQDTAPSGAGGAASDVPTLDSVLDCADGGAEPELTDAAGGDGTLEQAARSREVCFKRRVECVAATFQTAAKACLDCADAHECGQVTAECETLCEGMPQ